MHLCTCTLHALSMIILQPRASNFCKLFFMADWLAYNIFLPCAQSTVIIIALTVVQKFACDFIIIADRVHLT